MDKILLDTSKKVIEGAEINSDLMNLTSTELLKLETEVDKIFKGVFHYTPGNVSYKGLRRCTVEETVAHMTSRKSVRPIIDIARNNTYLVKMFFEFEGSPLPPRYLYLIYGDDLIYLGDSLINISPVISDKCISPAKTSLYIRLLRDKTGVNMVPYGIQRNGADSTGKVLYASIYGNTTRINKSPITRSETTLVLYLLVKYGLKSMFKRITGLDIITGSKTTLSKLGNKYTIFSSRGMRQRGYIGKDYTPTNISFAVPVTEDLDVVNDAIASLFYILDHFPTIKQEELENTDMWTLILGKTLFGNQNIANLLDITQKHLISLDGYVDSYMQSIISDEFGTTLGEDFSEDGFFKILIAISKNFTTWSAAAEVIAGSAYGKRYEILYYIMYNIITSVNRVGFELEQLKPESRTPYTVSMIFNYKLTPGKIFSIRDGNAACSHLSVCADNRLLKVSTTATLQLNTKNANRASKDNASVLDPSTILNATQVVSGTMYGIGKSNLAPQGFMNIFTPYDKTTNKLHTKIPDDIRPLEKVLSKMQRASNLELPDEFKT